jgi:acetate---CoA ligase (ADP-forming)
MRRLIHNPLQGKLRVFGYISGSGNTLWKIVELQRELEETWEGSPFEVAGCFSSDPEAKGVAVAKELGIPVVSIDLRQFYRDRGKKFADMDVRRSYDQAALELIEPMQPDLVVLAGYVWATTDIVLDRFTFLNVHPADLSVRHNGERTYAGANGVGDALAAGEKQLHASSHLATSELDGGPILCISPPVAVDYTLQKGSDDVDFMRSCLRQVNEQSRLTGARTIWEIAVGNFEIDREGKVFYQGLPVPSGLRIESWDQNKPRYQRNTEAMLKPSSVCVIGASAKGGIGQSVVKSLQASGYKGTINVVNRNGDEVCGITGYSSIHDIPGPVEMAVVTVPSPFVPEVARECGEKGVKAFVCISAGFKETGAEGTTAENELMKIIDRYNMRMLGPNCMGLSNNDPAVQLNTTILQDIPKKGNIAFVTQSGGLGAVLLDYAKHLGIGFSSIVSLGNQADMTANDILPMLAEDDATEVILLYLETIPDYYRFKTIASRLAEKKPVILLKAGGTEAGARAAGSHTGSLAGNDQVVDALIRSSGIIRAQTVYSAFFIAAALSHLPRPSGKRVAVVTNGGGPGILLSDALSRAGFEVPPLAEEVQKRLKPQLLPEASVTNPIDLVAPAPPEHYAEAVRQVVQCGSYDAVALLCIPPATIDTADVARGVVDGIKGMEEELSRIPLLSCFFGPGLGEGGRRVMGEAGFPSVEYPEQLAEVLAATVLKSEGPGSPGRTRYRTPGGTIRKAWNFLRPDGQNYIPQKEAWDLLKIYGFSVAQSRLVASFQEFENIEDQDMIYPLVLKIDHPDVVHKSDEGGVLLNIRDSREAAEGIKSLLTRFPGARGVLAQTQISSDREVILGAIRDEAAGHAVMVGLGGVFVELLKDVSFIHVPFSRASAEEALMSLKSAPLLTGYRGKPGVDIASLLDQIEKLGKLISDFPGIAEIDLNPLIFSSEKNSFFVADCRILLHN